MSARQSLTMRGDSREYVEDSEDDEGPTMGYCCPNVTSCACMTLPCCWPLWLCSVTVIDQKQHAAVMYWGKYQGTLSEPGIHILNPMGLSLRTASVQKQTLALKDLRCNDKRGSPIVVSGNIVYQISSVKKAMVDVQNPTDYLLQQAPMVLRMVCAKYPYDSNEGVSLRQSAVGHQVGEDLQNHLAEVVKVAGLEILKFDLTDLSYAPEIATVMLQKQQAEVMIEARQTIVRSAVDTASGAVRQIKSLGHTLTPAAEEKLITNLVTVIVADRGVQNVMPVGPV